MGANHTIENQHVILFDGVCNLCDSAVNFIIDHDKKGVFKFAALQSPYGRQTLEKLGLNTHEFNSMVLISNERVYQKSTAALKIAKKLNGLWPLLYIFMIIPAFIRHAFYDVIAKNRYKWWGRKDRCKIPTPELKQRFLEGY